jgi:hypothetical protein
MWGRFTGSLTYPEFDAAIPDPEVTGDIDKLKAWFKAEAAAGRTIRVPLKRA